MWVVVALVAGNVIGGLWIWISFHRVNASIDRVVSVLGQAGPGIARQLQEQSTKVTFGDRWEDDAEFFGDGR